MTRLLRGHLYFARAPGERKKRPVLIVSANVRNQAASTVVIIPATTAIRRGTWHIFLRAGDAGLGRDSELRCENIAAIPKRLIDEKPIGGPLSESTMERVRAALLDALDFDA